MKEHIEWLPGDVTALIEALPENTQIAIHIKEISPVVCAAISIGAKNRADPNLRCSVKPVNTSSNVYISTRTKNNKHNFL